MGKTPEELFQEREQRVHDAVQLKEPDRVPIMCLSGFFPAYYAGITCEEAMYDFEKCLQAWTLYLEDFAPDMTDNPFTTRFLGAVLEALDFKQLRWPGHGLDEMASYQFVEDEYMMADEYDRLLYDPTDFMIRTYWPRVFGVLKPFEALPPLHDIMSYYMGLGKFAVFGSPDMVEALEKLHEKEMKGLILDLRGNPGGLLHIAINIANNFLPSGTMCNQIAFRVWCQPGDEIIIDTTGHAIHSEIGGAAALSGLGHGYIQLDIANDLFNRRLATRGLIVKIGRYV